MGARATGPALITPRVPVGSAQGFPRPPTPAPGPSLPGVAGGPPGPQSHLGPGRGAHAGPGPRGEQPGLGRCAAQRRARAPDPARRPVPADPSPDTRRQLPSQIQRLRAMAAGGAGAGAPGARAGHTPPAPRALARSLRQAPAARAPRPLPGTGGAGPPRPTRPAPAPGPPRVPSRPLEPRVRAGVAGRAGGGRGARGPGSSPRASGQHLSRTGCKTASARRDPGPAPQTWEARAAKGALGLSTCEAAPQGLSGRCDRAWS